MLVTIRPSPGGIGGVIAAPPSKSMAHRAVLCAALAVGRSHITHLEFSKDISATLSAAAQLCGSGQGGRDVLAEFQMGDVRAPHSQRGAQHGAVRHAFAGRRGDHAPDAAGGRSDGYKHSGVILLQFPPGSASGVPLGELARQRLRG